MRTSTFNEVFRRCDVSGRLEVSPVLKFLFAEHGCDELDVDFHQAS